MIRIGDSGHQAVGSAEVSTLLTCTNQRFLYLLAPVGTNEKEGERRRIDRANPTKCGDNTKFVRWLETTRSLRLEGS